MGNSDVPEPVAPLLSIVDAVLRDILKLWSSTMAWEEYVFGFQVSLAQIFHLEVMLLVRAFVKKLKKEKKKHKKTKQLISQSCQTHLETFLSSEHPSKQLALIVELNAVQFSKHACTRSAISN